MDRLVLIISFIVYFLIPVTVHAQVVINEFSSATSKDWVELFFLEDIDINGWYIKDNKSNIKTIQTSELFGPTTNQYYVINVSNRLNKDKDTIYLFNSSDELIDEIKYGGQGNVCTPDEAGSIGRYPDANSTWERFTSSTKGNSNDEANLLPCPSPTPTQDPTNRPTVSPKPTKTPKPTSIQRSSQSITEPVQKNELKVLGEEDKKEEVSKKENSDLIDRSSEEISQRKIQNKVYNDQGDNPTVSEQSDNVEAYHSNIGALLFIVGGLGFIGASSYPIIKKKGLLNAIKREKE